MCITLDMLPLWDAIPEEGSGWKQAGGEPREIGAAAGLDPQDKEFRGGVAVQRTKSRFELVQAAGGGFEEQQDFRGRFDFPLPPVYGLSGRDEGGAGGEALLHQSVGQGLGFLTGTGGGEDDLGVGFGCNHRQYCMTRCPLSCSG